MKKLKLFFALFAMLALGVGNAWGAEETITLSDFGWSNASVQSSISATTATITLQKNSASTAPTYYTADGLRLYGVKSATTGGTISFTPKTGITISKIVFTHTVSNSGVLAIKTGTGTYTSSSKTWSGSLTEGNTVSLVSTNNTTKNPQVRITKIVITYETSGSEETTPSLTADPTTIDFGTVYEGATVADKTVAVNFANLTGAVTYSGLSTPFSATGTISATGDKITISADASTIGTYSQTLTVASTADSKTAEVTVKMNVVEKPAPTGTFTLHTGELIEGDYVIYYSGKAMKAAVSSNRLGYEEVTPSGNEIIDPLAETIWHIAPSGSNWTIYNDNKGYAAGNGTKNQAALVADPTGDNANKVAWTVTGTSTYEFVNVLNKSNSVNANLRNNGTYGFACYATSTGGALSLYRKAGAKYNVTVNSTTNGTVTADPTSAEAGTTITLTVTPAGGYVLDALTVTDASSNPVTVTDNKFTMPASDVTVTATFKLNEKPAATLTLSKNGVEETFPGSWKQDDVVTLPTTVDTDCVKEFVGWSADANCATEPEYAPGASYTLASTSQTLYAVYATVEGGEATASVDMATYANDNSWGSSSSTNQKEININSDLKAVISEGGNSGKYYNDGVRIYQTEDATVTVSTTAGELKSVKFTFTIANNGTLLHEGVAMTSDEAVEVSGNSAVFTVGDTHATENKGQVRFTAIEVVYTGGATYSNYSTTCSAALANPTFSLTEGKYTEAKSVEITATEGTVYYTTDGTTPTASTTQYTGAIALNDCGEYTIKAIAISADSQSDVVSASYTIKLPLTNSQAAPYTEAEAIAVYDGGCYDNQDVYVKGTVKTATFNSTYGNYTITLTNGFQFYRFLQAAETKFTEDIIVPGDVLVACGKLSKYNTTYQLAEGCYLVERIPYEGEKTDISNTEATAYTVAKAIELYDDVTSDLTKQVYVTGIVSEIVTAYNSTYGNISYNISDDGTTTSAQLQAYRGKSYNGENFTSADDIQVGDEVVVYGLLDKYNSKYQLKADNQLVSLVRPEQPEPEVSVATLPFAFDGKQADIANTLGMSHEGIDAGDYASSPHLKFNTTGDYLIIHFDSEPDKLSYDIKGNGFSGGTFTVQESADGETYTTIATYTELGETASEEKELASTSRYVKFIYTTKSSGNVALGNISITKYGESTEPEPEPELTNATYEKVTAEPADWSGEYILVYDNEDNNDCYVWTGADEVNGYTATTRNGNIISGTFVTITIAPMTGGYSVQVNGGTRNGKYVGGENGDNAIVYSDSEILNTITYNAVGIDLTSNTSVMRFNAATNQLRFRYYKSGQSAVQLYKKLSPIEIGEADNSAALATTGSVDVEVTRQFTTGNLYTIALPFTLNNVTEIFGNGTNLYVFTALAKDNNGDLVLQFQKASAIAAGTPYLIEPAQDVHGFTVEGITLSNTENSISKQVDGNTVTMEAVLSVTTAETTGGKFWLASDKYLYNNTNAMKSLRALFTITTPSGMPPRARVALGENAATDVDNIITTDAPQKVIENGQLIIIRNGEKFNVQGQKL